jgi:hypothetical protein
VSALAEAAVAYVRAGKITTGRNIKAMQAFTFRRLNDAALAFAKTSDEEWAAEVGALKELLREIYDASNGDGEWRCCYPDLAERIEKALDLEG